MVNQIPPAFNVPSYKRSNVPTFFPSPVDIQPLAGHNFPSAPSPTVAPITEEGE